jgi:GNAT superfamily N-acetyltransferase
VVGLAFADQGRIVGALKPVEWPHCQMTFGEKLRTALSMPAVMGTAVPRAMTVMSAWERRGPHRAHWHLGPIGVSPDLQGRGIGKAMMTCVLEMIDREAAPTSLETDPERSKPFCEAFGFAVTAEEDILGVGNRYMCRPARLGSRHGSAFDQLEPAGSMRNTG